MTNVTINDQSDQVFYGVYVLRFARFLLYNLFVDKNIKNLKRIVIISLTL